MAELETVTLNSHITLAVGWHQQAGLDGGRLELEDGVAETFVATAKNHIEALQERTVRPYSPEVDLEPKEEYLVANREELDDDDPILRLLEGIELQDPLSIRRLPSRSLLFYGYVFPQEAILLRKWNSHQSASRGKTFTRLTNTLTKIEDPVFAFDDRVDIVILDDQILISNKAAFEQLFKDNEYLVSNIPTWVNAIPMHLPLAPGSADTLVERCKSNSRLRRRLETIHRRGHLATVDISAVREEAIRQGIDASQIIRNGQLHFDQASTDDLLKLLNEDLLIGGLSGSKFAVDKKSPR